MDFPEFTAACPKGALQRKFTVEEEHTDRSGRMTPGALARQMEKATAMHLALFGIDGETLREKGLVWVVAWTDLSVRRMPEAGENVLLRVWPGRRKTVMYPRKYAFYSEAGEPLASACSLFTLMDGKTRKAAVPTEEMKKIPVVAIPGEPDLPPLRIPFPKVLGGCVTRTVQTWEADRNGHLNNTRYLDWAMDLADEIVPAGKTPKSVWVEYVKELLPGRLVHLRYAQQGTGLYIKGFCEGEPSFSLRVEGIA